MKKILLSLLLMTNGVVLAKAELPEHISKVYSYQCTKRFFEGEGVYPNHLACVANQNLGFYTANYTYYLYHNDRGNNFQQRGGTAYYGNNVCGMGAVDRYNCTVGNPTLQFGLSAVRTEKFSVGIQLNPNPEAGAVFMGWAAKTVDGECEQGLVKIRPYVVSPPTITQPLPTNFINNNKRLDSFVVSTDDHLLDAFTVTRIPSAVPCDARGYCSWPSGESSTALELPYEFAKGPQLCVVPAGSIH